MTTRSILHAACSAAMTLAYGVFAIAISPIVLIAMIAAGREEMRDLRIIAADAGMSIDDYLAAEHRRVADYYNNRRA